MDNERRLISRALYDTDIDTVLAAGVSPEMFGYPDNRAVFVYMQRCRRAYGRPPTPRMVKAEFPYYQLLSHVEEPLAYCIEEVQKAYRLDIVSEYGDRISDAIDDGDPTRAAQLMAEASRAAGDVNQTHDIEIHNVLEQYIEMFLGRANGSGLIGLPTGFETINNATLGFQPSQLVTIAGLAGAGKSTLLMLMAKHIQDAGFSPYFMSFEMSEAEQIGRYIAMGAGVNYRHLVSGRVTDKEKQKIDAYKVKALDSGVFALCTDIARSSTVSGLEAKLRDRKPDVAFIDGVYLMRDEQTKKSGSDWQAMTNITRDLKQMAQRLERPVIVSTQALMSKTSAVRNSGRRRLDMYSMGYSSSFAQDSDVALALERDEQRDTERLLRITKSRHSANYSVWIAWNWKQSLFGEELRKEEEPYEDDDEEDEDE